MTKSIVRVILKANSGCWVPLGMLLGDAFLGVSLDLVLKKAIFLVKTDLNEDVLYQRNGILDINCKL
jgi:hypothetical protein